LNSGKIIAKITEKWPAKVLSVAAALLLSVFHRMSTLETRFFSTPLHIETGEGLLIPTNSHTQTIRVSMRGEANSIYPILESDIETYIDAGRYLVEGSYKAPVQIRKRGTALGVEPLEISVEPLEISLYLERKLEKTVPIKPVFRGKVADGYVLAGQSLVPANAAAEGPRSVLETVSEFHTEAIDLNGRQRDFSVTVNIIKNDPRVVLPENRTVEYRGLIRRAGDGGE
jgi:YbbR domain-containing protein